MVSNTVTVAIDVSWFPDASAAVSVTQFTPKLLALKNEGLTDSVNPETLSKDPLLT